MSKIQHNISKVLTTFYPKEHLKNFSVKNAKKNFKYLFLIRFIRKPTQHALGNGWNKLRNLIDKRSRSIQFAQQNLAKALIKNLSNVVLKKEKSKKSAQTFRWKQKKKSDVDEA